jgi:hypothetical protein
MHEPNNTDFILDDTMVYIGHRQGWGGPMLFGLNLEDRRYHT